MNEQNSNFHIKSPYTRIIYLYVLQLENNKIYVGKTENVDKRVNDHLLGYGAEWTRRFKVLNLIECIILNDAFDEDKYVKKYMNIYGINNVRGGTYSNLILNKDQKRVIAAELKTANNQCYKCGGIDHFVRNCIN